MTSETIGLGEATGARGAARWWALLREALGGERHDYTACLLYTSPSPRDS